MAHLSEKEKQYFKQYRKKNGEKRRLYDKKYRAANDQRLKEYRIGRKKVHADVYRAWKYGLGLGVYAAMFKRQHGRCAICKQVNKEKPLHVDHDHKTKAVRELLCKKCNGVLGYADDSPNKLRLAAAYLEKHGEQNGNNDRSATTTKRRQILRDTRRRPPTICDQHFGSNFQTSIDRLGCESRAGTGFGSFQSTISRRGRDSTHGIDRMDFDDAIAPREDEGSQEGVAEGSRHWESGPCVD
jgi:hypothetical protein